MIWTVPAEAHELRSKDKALTKQFRNTPEYISIKGDLFGSQSFVALVRGHN